MFITYDRLNFIPIQCGGTVKFDSGLITQLRKIAREVRIDIIKMIHQAKSGHPGGSLSATDIGVSLFFSHMKYEPTDPFWENRDRFVLSKGHAAPMLYAVLKQLGLIKPEMLETLRQLHSPLQGHPDMKKLPGVEMSTGSLGQGLSVGNGMAMGAKLDNKDSRVYVLIGDGELQEGQIWEAALTSAHYKLDNLTAIIDHNGLQIDGANDEVKRVTPVAEKFRAFGWNAITIDGHNYYEILSALMLASSTKNRPTAIIAETIKGKGVSFMENVVDFHGKAPSEDEYNIALKELNS
jgi:transketolase